MSEQAEDRITHESVREPGFLPKRRNKRRPMIRGRGPAELGLPSKAVQELARLGHQLRFRQLHSRC
jgi:hypothetical protein